jgi:stearoyl-CoA desaturase (delta-9 desaturase)
VRRLAPKPKFAAAPRPVDIEMLTAVLQNRMHVLRDYTRKVTLPVLRVEKRANRYKALPRRARRLLVSGPILLDDIAKDKLATILKSNTALRTVHEFRQQLLNIWAQANVSNERLVKQLKEWCSRAEASGIDSLQNFSARLRGYILQPAPI